MGLGQVNFDELNNYTVKPQDMTDTQTFLQDGLRLLLKNGFNSGVVTGCEVVPGAGFEVTVKAGAFVTPDGRYVIIDNDITVPLDASDPANPRLDRIEVEYALANGRQDINEDSVNVYVTKNVVATASKITGVANVAPVAPNKSSAKISLAVVSIQASAVVISSASINTSMKYRDFFSLRKKLPDLEILNDQSAFASLQNLAFDKTKHKQVRIWGDIYREDLGQSKTDSVSIVLILNKKSSTWVPFISVQGEDTGVELAFDQVKQEIQYKSSDFSGGGYIGEMKVNIEFIER